jgi:hypothetical protein
MRGLILVALLFAATPAHGWYIDTGSRQVWGSPVSMGLGDSGGSAVAISGSIVVLSNRFDGIAYRASGVTAYLNCNGIEPRVARGLPPQGPWSAACRVAPHAGGPWSSRRVLLFPDGMFAP